MKRIKELLAKFEDGSITDDEKKELKTLLDDIETKSEANKPDEGSEDNVEVVDVSAGVINQLKDAITEIIDKRLESIEAVKPPKPIGKGVEGEENKPEVIVEDESKLEGKILFAKQLIAMDRGNRSEVARLNKIAVKGLPIELKANYQNETTSSDGGALVPPADFYADVARLDGVFGVSLRDARVIQVNSNSVTVNRKSAGVSLTKVGEAVAKPGTKMTFAQDLVVLDKYAGIAPYTEELEMDGAVAIYDELVKDFALARNKKADELVFTDATSGLAHTAGVNAYTFGAGFANIDFDDMAGMIGQLGQRARIGAKFYISRAVETALRTAKVTTTYAWVQASQGVPGTIWGYPYELVDVLPIDAQTNAMYAVFGNLQWVVVAMKRGLDITILTEGTVHDSGNAAINLAEQDMKAVRAVTRMASRVQFAVGFSIGGLGSVS